MCKIVEDLREEARSQIAIRLLQGGKLSVEEIASAAGLPLREVERISTKLKGMSPVGYRTHSLTT